LESINKLLAYDFKEESIENNHPVIQILSEDDRQTILSLKSLNPEIEIDGSLLFEIEPPVLNYLRKKNVSESKDAKLVKVLDKPIKPTAEVAYDQNTGVTVKTGYKLEDDQKLLSANEIKLTKDGKYTRLGNTFIPIAKVSSEVEDMLQKGEVNYSIKNIPEFFLRDLVLIKKEFNAVLTDLVKKYNAEGGLVIVQEPKTGKILAMDSYPTFDPNNYSEFPIKNFLNPVVQSIYEPGSVFKVLTMASALDAGAVTPETIFTDTGSIMVGGTTITNWNYGAWGEQDMTGCLQHSLNVCLSWVAVQLGADKFYTYLKTLALTGTLA